MRPFPRLEDIREDEVSALLDYLLRMVVALTPASVLISLGFVALDRVGWRSATFTAMVVLLTVASAVVLRARKRGGARATLPRVMAVAAGVQIVGVVVTGGIESPFAPETVLLALVLASFLPPSWARACVVAQMIAFGALTVAQATGGLADALPRVFGGGARAGTPLLAWVRGVAIVGFLYSALVIGERMRATFEAVGRRSVRARDEALASYADETRALTLFAGEIAHELKNPLATVKGLSSLVANDLREGKNAERIAILRREAERMQSVLEDFLNFSRPLVPLAEQPVSLEELCWEVARLHEGMAGEHGIRFAVRVPPELEVRADRRKIKQVLINLVQNAIAASPDGGEITVRASETARDGAPTVEIEVIDRGQGVTPALEGRVFEPGITSKPGGSGFGLTVSRALARQHGGDLTLASGAGGCTATLTLPRARDAHAGEVAA